MIEKSEYVPKMVAGYEFEESDRFSRETVWILENVQRKGAVYFSVDDGYHPEIEELKEASKYGYFEVFESDGGRLFAVISTEDKFWLEVEATDPDYPKI